VGFIVTTLTDSGVGMTEQQQQNAFNPLCNEKGYLGGLGLQRVKSLAESLNGSVKIFS
jgi:sensor histidine kinase regulating citrate/malate metabolism